MTTTKILRAGMSGAGYDVLSKALRECLPFKTAGALRGEKWERRSVFYMDLGELNKAEANRFMIDHMAGIDYVVWSYLTPIGWVRDDGVVYTVSQKFSHTTSKHQGRLWCLGTNR